MSPTRILSLWLPVVAFMAGLFYLSSRGDLTGAPGAWDKVLHLGAYAALATLALRAFHGGLKPLRRQPMLWGVLLTVGYGLLDEIHQSQVAGRHASGMDWVADAAGATLAVPLVALLVAVRERAFAVRPTSNDRGE